MDEREAGALRELELRDWQERLDLLECRLTSPWWKGNFDWARLGVPISALVGFALASLAPEAWGLRPEWGLAAGVVVGSCVFSAVMLRRRAEVAALRAAIRERKSVSAASHAAS